MNTAILRPVRLLAVVGLLSALVALVTQITAADGDYVALLKALLFFGCLPQIGLLALLEAAGKKAPILVGLSMVLVSWLFVAELAIRVLF